MILLWKGTSAPVASIFPAMPLFSGDPDDWFYSWNVWLLCFPETCKKKVPWLDPRRARHAKPTWQITEYKNLPILFKAELYANGLETVYRCNVQSIPWKQSLLPRLTPSDTVPITAPYCSQSQSSFPFAIRYWWCVSAIYFSASWPSPEMCHASSQSFAPLRFTERFQVCFPVHFVRNVFYQSAAWQSAANWHQLPCLEPLIEGASFRKIPVNKFKRQLRKLTELKLWSNNEMFRKGCPERDSA